MEVSRAVPFPDRTDPKTMASNWLVLNIPLAIVAFAVVAGLPLWALWRYSADDLFGRPDRPLSPRGSAGDDGSFERSPAPVEPYPVASGPAVTDPAGLAPAAPEEERPVRAGSWR